MYVAAAQPIGRGDFSFALMCCLVRGECRFEAPLTWSRGRPPILGQVPAQEPRELPFLTNEPARGQEETQGGPALPVALQPAVALSGSPTLR